MSIALVCIAKNEDHYIDEWLKYNLKLQFSAIYVYQNNWRYQGDKSQYSNVYWEIIDGEKMQFAAYNDFLCKHIDEYDWACFFDCDEFLILKGYDNVHKYFSKYNARYGIAINWKIFGDGHSQFDEKEYSVLKRFKMRQKTCDKHVKACLNLSKLKNNYNVNQLKFDNPHYITIAKDKCLMRSSDDTKYVIGPFNSNYNDNNIYICHFFGKTVNEYIKKQQRGCAAALNTRLNMTLFNAYNINDEFDDYAFKFMHDLQQNKTIKIDDLIENSFVISIDQIRYHSFIESFKKVNFDIFPKLINGFIINSQFNKCYKIPPLNYPILGNSFTHASIVKWAQTFNKDFVCIFEDDAFPCTELYDKLQYYLTNIPDNVGILKIGVSVVADVSNKQIIDNKYIKGIKTFGSHAYIVFKSYYDEYFKLFEHNIICDNDTFNNGKNIYTTKENLFIQKTLSKNSKTINSPKRNVNVIEYHAEDVDLININRQL